MKTIRVWSYHPLAPTEKYESESISVFVASGGALVVDVMDSNGDVRRIGFAQSYWKRFEFSVPAELAKEVVDGQ